MPNLLTVLTQFQYSMHKQEIAASTEKVEISPEKEAANSNQQPKEEKDLSQDGSHHSVEESEKDDQSNESEVDQPKLKGFKTEMLHKSNQSSQVLVSGISGSGGSGEPPENSGSSQGSGSHSQPPDLLKAIRGLSTQLQSSNKKLAKVMKKLESVEGGMIEMRSQVEEMRSQVEEMRSQVEETKAKLEDK